MLIAHISDTHVVEQGKKAYGLVPTSEFFERCVKHMNELEPKIDVVLITGDLCNNPTFEENIRASEILKELKIPYFIVPGNHDKRSYLLNSFSEVGCPTEMDDFIQYVVDDYPIRLIALDSTIEGKPGGELCPKRLAWLDKELAKDKEKPTILFLHHPPVRYSVHETDTDGFIGAEDFGDIVEKYSNIKRILCGHVHMNCHAGWRNTTISSSASMGMQLNIDLTLEKESEFMIELPSYQLHYQIANSELISYVMSVSGVDAPGPFLFKEYRKLDDR